MSVPYLPRMYSRQASPDANHGSIANRRSGKLFVEPLQDCLRSYSVTNFISTLALFEDNFYAILQAGGEKRVENNHNVVDRRSCAILEGVIYQRQPVAFP